MPDGSDCPARFFSFRTVELLSGIKNHAEGIVVAIVLGGPKGAASFLGENGVHAQIHFGTYLLAIKFFRFIECGQFLDRLESPVQVICKSFLVEFFNVIKSLKPVQPVAFILVGVFLHPQEPGLRVGDGFVVVIDEAFVLGIFNVLGFTRNASR